MKLNKSPKKVAATPASIPFGDRPAQPPANSGKATEAFTQAELAAWVAKAKELPDIRWDKVQAMREAVRSESFDLDSRLANLSDRLPDELIEYLRQLGNE